MSHFPSNKTFIEFSNIKICILSRPDLCIQLVDLFIKTLHYPGHVCICPEYYYDTQISHHQYQSYNAYFQWTRTPTCPYVLEYCIYVHFVELDHPFVMIYLYEISMYIPIFITLLLIQDRCEDSPLYLTCSTWYTLTCGRRWSSPSNIYYTHTYIYTVLDKYVAMYVNIYTDFYVYYQYT